MPQQGATGEHASLALNLGPRPSDSEVLQRFHSMHNRHGHPYFLPTCKEVYPEGDGATPPWSCTGAAMRGKFTRRRNCCGQYNFCCFCWERRARLNALKTAAIHLGQANIHRISIPLGGSLTSPKDALTAVQRVSGQMRRHGFRRQSLWIHPFTNHPLRGARPHIQGVISGQDANTDILQPDAPRGLASVVRPFLFDENGAMWPPEVHLNADFHAHSRTHIRELLSAGYEAGQPCLHVRRIQAGLYEENGEVLARLTNVHRAIHKSQLQDLADVEGNALPDCRWSELLQATCTAEAWRKQRGRPTLTRGVKLSDEHMELLLQHTYWRSYYRLPSDRELRERYGV